MPSMRRWLNYVLIGQTPVVEPDVLKWQSEKVGHQIRNRIPIST
jgi:hypothetical protein